MSVRTSVFKNQRHIAKQITPLSEWGYFFGAELNQTDSVQIFNTDIQCRVLNWVLNCVKKAVLRKQCYENGCIKKTGEL